MKDGFEDGFASGAVFGAVVTVVMMVVYLMLLPDMTPGPYACGGALAGACRFSLLSNVPALSYAFPKNERLEFLQTELKLRSRCEREDGVFLWSGVPDQEMRCWKDVCVRREEGCLGSDIVFEVDPEKDDFYRFGAYR